MQKKMESLIKKQNQLSEEYEVQSFREKDIEDDAKNKEKEEETVKKPKVKKTKKKLIINE